MVQSPLKKKKKVRRTGSLFAALTEANQKDIYGIFFVCLFFEFQDPLSVPLSYPPHVTLHQTLSKPQVAAPFLPKP